MWFSKVIVSFKKKKLEFMQMRSKIIIKFFYSSYFNHSTNLFTLLTTSQIRFLSFTFIWDIFIYLFIWDSLYFCTLVKQKKKKDLKSALLTIFDASLQLQLSKF